jgi:NAD(P)H-flavin reductase
MEWEAKILKVKDYKDEGKISDRILLLSTPADFSFQAGQFVMIGHDSVKNKSNPTQLKWGSMSIASSSQQKGSLELVISVGEPQGITYFVANNRKVGDTIKARGPFGVFGIKEAYDELVFVGAGTGIAPMMAMIRSKLDSGEKKPVTLFFGFKKMDKFLYQEELESLKKRFSNFRFFYITSREPTQEGKQGHVQELLKGFKFDKKKNIHFYLCGPPVAITDIRNVLKETGFAEQQVHFEQWG